MTTTNLKYTRNDVCDNLKLPYCVEDYILFDSIGNQLENGDVELINERDCVIDEINAAEETIKELKQKTSRLEKTIEEQSDKISDLITDKWNLQQELEYQKSK